MTEEKTAFIALYGVTSEEIQEELTENEIGAINERLHIALDEKGVDVESVSLRTDM